MRLERPHGHWVLSAIVVLTAVFLSAGTLRAQTPKRLALVGGMLLIGYEAPPIHNAAILIEGNKIVAAGSDIMDLPPTMLELLGVLLPPDPGGRPLLQERVAHEDANFR